MMKHETQSVSGEGAPVDSVPPRLHEGRGFSRSRDGVLSRSFYVGRFARIVATVHPNGPPWRYVVELHEKSESGTWAEAKKRILGGETVHKLRHARVFATRLADREVQKLVFKNGSGERE